MLTGISCCFVSVQSVTPHKIFYVGGIVVSGDN